MLVAFSSPVKFSKSVFLLWNFVQSLVFVLQKQLLSVVANHSKSEFSTANCIADTGSEEIREVYSRNSLKHSSDQRGKLD